MFLLFYGVHKAPVNVETNGVFLSSSIYHGVVYDDETTQYRIKIRSTLFQFTKQLRGLLAHDIGPEIINSISQPRISFITQ